MNDRWSENAGGAIQALQSMSKQRRIQRLLRSHSTYYAGWMSVLNRTRSRLLCLLCLAISVLAQTAARETALAAPGDGAGWQYLAEGTGDEEHEYLTYVEHADGPRQLTFACKRDIDTFGFLAEDLSDLIGPRDKATLTLSSGIAKFSIPGSIEPDPETQAAGFLAEVPQSNGGQSQLAAALQQLLLSGKPIHMAFGPKSRDLPPVTGLLDPGRRFMRACFGHALLPQK